MASTVNPESPSAETLAPELKRVIVINNSTKNLVVIEVTLRVLLFATTLASVLVLVTGNQTKLIPILFPPYGASVSAEFTDTPAFIYSVSAHSVACLCSIITIFLSFFALTKRTDHISRKLMSHVVIDVLVLGMVTSAAGAAGEVAYLGLKGNSHVHWNKICNVYDSFCRHIRFSVLCSVFASIVLICFILFSFVSLSPKNPN